MTILFHCLAKSQKPIKSRIMLHQNTMKSIALAVSTSLLSLTSWTQNIPVDYEPGGFGADWTWTVFENDYNPAVEMVENPDTTGINCSSTVAQFTALATGNPWAGYESTHGAGIGEWTIDADNSIINIMVYKPVISDVGIKLVAADGFSLGEIKIPNTVINEWEVLSFDFSAHIGNTYDQIVIFPDFDLAGRVGDNICFIDNIYGDTLYPCAEDTTVIDDSGIEEFANSNIILFPNPAESAINLRFANQFSGTIVITDLLGKEILIVNSTSQNVQIELSGLPASGIYFTKIVSSDGEILDVKKFLYH